MKIVNDYGQRITWHLYRMYRARNSVIHSGETPKNLKMLGEHLHVYVDSIIYEILSRMSSYNNLNSIESAMFEAHISYDIFIELLKKDKLDKNDLKIFFFTYKSYSLVVSDTDLN